MLNNDGYITTSPMLPTSDTNNNCNRALGLSKVYFLLGVIDIFYSIYYSFTFDSLCLLLIPVTWLGLYSFKDYNMVSLLGYIMLFSISCIFKLVILYYSTNPLVFIINFAGVIMSMYTVYITKEFHNQIEKIPESELSNMKSDTYVPSYDEFVYF